MQFIRPTTNPNSLETVDSESPYIQPIVPESLKVPVPKGLDINEIIQQNTEIYQELINYQVTKYKPLLEFPVTNLYEQKRLVILKEFQNIPSHYIEQILNEIFTDYEWSYLNYDQLTIFVKYNKEIMDYESLGDVCNEILYDTDITDEIPLPEVKPITNKSNSKIMNILKSARLTESKPDNNLYKNYQVDPNELIDVPKDMKQEIIQQLIKFRSKILVKERENRKAKLKQDRLNSKKLLNQTIKLDTMDIDVKYKEPEEDDITDEEYLKMIESRLARDQERDFKVKLNKFNSGRIHKMNLNRKLESLKNYEDELINKKLSYLNNVKLLVVNRSFRNQEEEMDMVNRVQFPNEKRDKPKEVIQPITEDHTEEVPETVLENSVPETVSENSVPEQQPKPTQESLSIKDISNIPDDKKPKINHQVESLVMKYLGIKDEDLIAYLFTSIEEGTLTYEDLYETLDDDSTKFINELNSFIENLQKKNNY